MTKEELDEEIEFIHSNRTNKRLLRPLEKMSKFIISATNTYTNLSLFMNDYMGLFATGVFSADEYCAAMNDLYLLALLHTSYEETEQ